MSHKDVISVPMFLARMPRLFKRLPGIVKGIKVGRKRVLRLMRENNLLSPHRVVQGQPKEHTGKIITAAPNVMWGTDGTKVFTLDEGWCWIFTAVEHWNAEAGSVWMHRITNAFPRLVWMNPEPRERWEKHFAVVQYAASAVWNASFWHGVNLRIQVEGRQIQGHYLLALVSNIHLYAGGLAELSPDARLDDGIMDLWLFEGKTLGDTVQRAWDLWGGRHVHSDQVHRISFRSIEMESESPTFLQVDGEPLEGRGKVSIEVKPRALHVLLHLVERELARVVSELGGRAVEDTEHMVTETLIRGMYRYWRDVIVYRSSAAQPQFNGIVIQPLQENGVTARVFPAVIQHQDLEDAGSVQGAVPFGKGIPGRGT